MARYEIFLRRSAARELRGIPTGDLRRIVARIRGLAENPRPAGARKLSGQERYRLRQGDYRIVYSIQDDGRSVWAVKVGHRREVHER